MNLEQRKLFRVLIHGMSSPEEILAMSELSSRLRKILEPLVGQYDEILEFRKAYDVMSAKAGIQYKPPDSVDASLRWHDNMGRWHEDIGRLVISNRVDLTELELTYLFRLAELGIPIRFEFPIDNSGNGFSLPTHHLATRIEKRHDLKNIEISFKPFMAPPNYARYEAPDLVQEARLVAQVVRGYSPDKKIAVAMRTLDKRALIFEDALKAHGLFLKLQELPDLMGRQFDLVIIIDAAHGRLTRSQELNWPLRDSDCFEINHLMGREVLRRFEEDPLEPSLFSPRQALEPMWFLGASSAARENLVVTSSLLDDRYQAQVTSELVNLDWLGEVKSVEIFDRPLASLEAALQRIVIPAKAGIQNRSPDSVDASLRWHDNMGCQHDKIQLDRDIFRNRFASKLGLLESRPLSATRLEAFAKCPFRAFIEKLLEVDLRPAAGTDVEPRVLGQLAHAVLEKYYSDAVMPAEAGIQNRPPDSMDTSLRWYDRLSRIFSVEAERLLAENPDVHRGLWKAMMAWLEGALVRLVSNLDKNPPVRDAKPVAYEQKLGPLPVQVGEDKVYLGGIADRIDQSPEANIVIDYKFSSLSSLKMRLAKKEILKTHFQIPIYLKLLSCWRRPASLDPGLRQGDMEMGEGYLGYAVSIKDSAPGSMINMADRFEELDQAIVYLLEPILQGVLKQDSEACKDCQYKRLCRR
ncbi:MAG: PD-(D/E)XK nuclease family protein [Deltaproteobacteria bacterium]|nr:PD-(D/E)XK nuclease family protein [Deltaproteobacteria bacterium]